MNILDPHTALANYVSTWVFSKTGTRPKTIDKLSLPDLELLILAIDAVEEEARGSPDRDF